MAKAAPKRGKNKDNARRSKKKISLLTQEKVDYVDYKDVNMLRRFMSDRAKIRARRVSGNDSQQQKEIASRMHAKWRSFPTRTVSPPSVAAVAIVEIVENAVIVACASRTPSSRIARPEKRSR